MSLFTRKLPPFTLGATQTVADLEAIPLGPEGFLSIHCQIDNGTDDTAPSDTPVGSWQLYCAGQDGTTFARITGAETGTYSLADIAPSGNSVVNAMANFESVPGARCKIRYVRSSGGATARATLYVTTR